MWEDTTAPRDARLDEDAALPASQAQIDRDERAWGENMVLGQLSWGASTGYARFSARIQIKMICLRSASIGPRLRPPIYSEQRRRDRFGHSSRFVQLVAAERLAQSVHVSRWTGSVPQL